MSDDLLELALEGIGHVTDRYHDVVYGRVSGIGPWIKQRRSRSRLRRSSSVPALVVTEETAPAAALAAPAIVIEEDNSRGRKSKPRGRSAYREYEEDEVRDKNGNVTVREYHDTEYRPSRSRGRDIYAEPPYPTSGELAMPANDAYYEERAYANYELDRPRSRRRDSLSSSRSSSIDRDISRGREKDRDRDRDRDYKHHSDKSKKDRHHHHDHHHHQKDYHVAAGLAGAAAGAFVGQKVGKGDMKAVVAGALVGALGAGVADRQYDHIKEKRHRERDTEREWSYGR